MKEVDRAIADGEEEGFVKVHVRKGTDKILGATIVARHAGEMINEISLAMAGIQGPSPSLIESRAVWFVLWLSLPDGRTLLTGGADRMIRR